MAGGQCDNLLLATWLSATCPVVLAPAMDEDMWRHPATRANLDKLKTYGHSVIPVEKGELASGLYGEGRMAEPETIVRYLREHFESSPGRIRLHPLRPDLANASSRHRSRPAAFHGNWPAKKPSSRQARPMKPSTPSASSATTPRAKWGSPSPGNWPPAAQPSTWYSALPPKKPGIFPE